MFTRVIIKQTRRIIIQFQANRAVSHRLDHHGVGFRTTNWVLRKHEITYVITLVIRLLINNKNVSGVLVQMHNRRRTTIDIDSLLAFIVGLKLTTFLWTKSNRKFLDLLVTNNSTVGSTRFRCLRGRQRGLRNFAAALTFTLVKRSHGS